MKCCQGPPANRWRPLTAFPLKILDNVSSIGSGAGIAASSRRGSTSKGTKFSNLYKHLIKFFLTIPGIFGSPHVYLQWFWTLPRVGVSIHTARILQNLKLTSAVYLCDSYCLFATSRHCSPIEYMPPKFFYWKWSLRTVSCKLLLVLGSSSIHKWWVKRSSIIGTNRPNCKHNILSGKQRNLIVLFSPFSFDLKLHLHC